MQILVALIAGLVFGLGLVVSGMSNPSKVLNFLDLFGSFDPSLIFVLGGAVLVTFFGYRFVWRMPSPLFSGSFDEPISKVVDGKLIVGAVLFGIGWGLVGLCPGPALSVLTFGGLSVLIFFVALLLGLVVARVVGRFI